MYRWDERPNVACMQRRCRRTQLSRSARCSLSARARSAGCRARAAGGVAAGSAGRTACRGRGGRATPARGTSGGLLSVAGRSGAVFTTRTSRVGDAGRASRRPPMVGPGARPTGGRDTGRARACTRAEQRPGAARRRPGALREDRSCRRNCARSSSEAGSAWPPPPSTSNVFSRWSRFETKKTPVGPALDLDRSADRTQR